MRAIVACALLAACGYSEAHFAEDLADATCDWTVACLPDLANEVDDPCPPPDLADLDCAYDPVVARSCVRGVTLMECPEEGEHARWPEQCDRVYDCTELAE